MANLYEVRIGDVAHDTVVDWAADGPVFPTRADAEQWAQEHTGARQVFSITELDKQGEV